MGKAASLALQGDVLTVRHEGRSRPSHAGQAFVLEVADEAASRTLLASLPLLDRLLAEKVAAVRERRMAEMVDFMAARLLNEFGFFTAEQLADANGSQASNRAALADNWRKRRQVFAVPHPDKAARERDVYPAFQFENGKPIKAVQDVLEAFGSRKSPWKLALWFASNNCGLPGSARPVDLLASDQQAVVETAQRDAEGSAA